MAKITNNQGSNLEIELRYDSCVYKKHPIVITKGSGAKVFDENGKEYIDCIGGYGVANVGHTNQMVVDAIKDQVERLMTCPQSLPNDKRAEFLRTLINLMPDNLNRAFLCNSGTESIEAALKFARIATGRSRFIAMDSGFSGRSLGALGLTWEPKYRKPYQPMVYEADFIPFNDADALKNTINTETAAVFIELIQGEGGVRPVSHEFVRVLRQLTKETGALLVIDEIQTGFCRTGKFFAFEHFGVEPDMITLAKAMAGGVPIGVLVMTEEIAKPMPKGGHGTTFGGNPLAMAAGVAAINFMKEQNLSEKAEKLGNYFLNGLKSIKSAKIKDVRGLGLMIGVELHEEVSPYLEKLELDGVLALQATPKVMRYLPPLVINKEEIDKVVATTQKILE